MGRRNSITTSALSFWSAAFLLLIIIGVAMLALRRDAHPTVIAFRAGLVAVGLVGLVIVTFLSRRSGPSPRSLAEQILAQQKSLFNAPHDFQPASAADFSDLDKTFYDHTQRALEAHGFRFLDDVENTTISQALPAFRTFIRTMIGDDDATAARILQMRPSGSAGADHRIIELTTEFSDFTFLITTTGALPLDSATVDGITRHMLPPDTAPDQLLTRHREHLSAALAKNPSLTVVRCLTLDDVLKSSRHAHAVRAVHRKRTGYVTEDDLKRIRGEPLTDLDRKIFDEINALEAADRTSDSSRT
ncbi:MAG TPA: hypothetical protein VF669_17705 [Tepidisphaeraceae bacterium]|jgi:hypothetical protein